MAKGENIFKRKDGRWEARYVKGYELSGKIKYGFCYGKTYKEAKEKVSQCKAAVAAGRPLPGGSSNHRLGYYCDEWLKSGKNRLKDSSYVKYNTIIERHIKPKLGACFPLAISTALIEAFTDELLHCHGLSPKTVKDILTTLRSVLKYTAEQIGGTFPIINISYPKDTKKEMRVLSRREQSVFISYLLQDMDECKFGVLLALLTGMRIGELCALRWDAISMEEKTIRITATMQRLRDVDAVGPHKTRICITSPKSDHSARIIPMTKNIAELCCRMQPLQPNAFVLTGTSDFIEPRTLQYRLDKYVRCCGLEGVHFHTLRHTFATRCVEVGFEIKSLSEILGHSTTTITLDRYVHSSIELKRSNMDKLTAIGF